VTPRKPHPDIDSLGFMLSTVGHAISRRFIHALEPLQLHPREFAVLRAVKAGDGQSQQALADRLRIPPSRMVAIVDELESRGLIERRQDPSDRRVRTLYVTEAGQTLLDDAFKLAMHHERAISDLLSQDERSELLRILNRLAGNLGLPPDAHSALGDGDRQTQS
jgi:DNA-binding MarR family transcriptional regulator